MNESESVRKAPPKSARRRSREFALQGIYQWLLSGEDAGAVAAHIALIPGFERSDKEHFDALLYGVIRDAEALRAEIAPHLDRPIGELSPVEHAILLIGCHELRHELAVPYRVIINEGVELAKSFGGTDGFKFVNGVLDKIAAVSRPAEVKARGQKTGR
ncbi:transcription antitermination factor NusB [soil metagenome]